MQKPIPLYAFKIEYNVISNSLVTQAHVFDFENMNKAVFDAIWDTGATSSVITANVVNKLNLKPTGMTKVCGVNNQKYCHTYIVNLGLPNMVKINNLNVVESDMEGSDLLIGMDVIALGDFSISNHNKTTFCYSLPAHHNQIDLLERANKINKKNKFTK